MAKDPPDPPEARVQKLRLSAKQYFDHKKFYWTIQNCLFFFTMCLPCFRWCLHHPSSSDCFHLLILLDSLWLSSLSLVQPVVIRSFANFVVLLCLDLMCLGLVLGWAPTSHRRITKCPSRYSRKLSNWSKKSEKLLNPGGGCDAGDGCGKYMWLLSKQSTFITNKDGKSSCWHLDYPTISELGPRMRRQPRTATQGSPEIRIQIHFLDVTKQ